MTPWSRTLMGLGMLCSLIAPALAQTGAAAPAAACAPAPEHRPSDLHGLWRLLLWPEGGSESQPISIGAVLFGPHPEYRDSVRGRLRRSGPGADIEAEVAGDVADDGEFNLDESADGTNMDATWTGLAKACDGSIRGERRPTPGRSSSSQVWRFLLLKSDQPPRAQ